MIAIFFLFIFATVSTENEEVKKICCCSRSSKISSLPSMKFVEFRQATPKILGSLANSSKMKVAGGQRRRLEPQSAVFPNETAVKVFQDAKTNKIYWVDPNNLVDHQMRAQIGICLQQTGGELSNCLFDFVSEWFHTIYYIPESKLPFVRELLFVMSENVDVERQDELGRTPMMFAARFDAEKAVMELINWRAKLDAADEFGWTALHSAANNGSGNSCRVLLKNGANPNSTDDYGSTPLMFAANYGYIRAVEVLLDFNADAYVKNKNGETALDRAASYTEVIEALKAKMKQKNKF